jgi:hypothetical protein
MNLVERLVSSMNGGAKSSGSCPALCHCRSCQRFWRLARKIARMKLTQGIIHDH